jgi:2-amino-4-hydroxy-6-hydroxymethyldihydropteridine diphosphokinase
LWLDAGGSCPVKLQAEVVSAMATEALDCVIGLGANLGDVRAAFCRALGRMGRVGTVTAISSLYDTRPVGGPPQPRYLNAAARMITTLTPRGLLLALVEIEHSEGRERRVRWAARTLDLDILWIDGRAVDEPGLSIPHPRLGERAFALLPLLEVADKATDPRTGLAYAELKSSLDASAAIRLGDAWAPLGMDTRAP